MLIIPRTSLHRGSFYGNFRCNQGLPQVSFHSPHVRALKIVLDSGFQALESGLFVSGTWILDSNRHQDSGFLELYPGIQSPGFRIPQTQISRIPESLNYLRRSQSTKQPSQAEAKAKGRERKEKLGFLIVLLSASLYNHDIELTRLMLFFLGILLLIT